MVVSGANSGRARDVAALAERGCGRAPHFPRIDQANAVSGRVYSSARTFAPVHWLHKGQKSGGREIVAALAERGRRRAPHFLKFDQAEPTRSATVSDRVYKGALTFAPLTNGLVKALIFRRRRLRYRSLG